MADDLRAEQPARALLGDELDADGLGAGEVARPGRRVDRGADEAVPGRLGLGLGQPGARHLHVADLRDRGADHAGERGVAAAEVDPRHPALLVGVRAQRHDHALAGQAVDRLDAVARRPHARHLGAHAVVDGDAARRAERDTGVAGQRDVGPHAQPEHDEVGGQLPAGRGVHARGPAVLVGHDLDDGVGQHQLDAKAAHGVGDERPDVGVEHADRGGRAVDDRHRKPADLAGLGDLETDVAAADDHDAAHVLGERGPQRRAVVEGLHAVHAGGVDARHRGPRGHAARGVDEVVERLGRTRGRVSRSRACTWRPARSMPIDLGAGADVDVVAPVLLGGPRHQLLLALDVAADPVGDAARRVGRGASPLERHDLQLVGPAPLARLAGGAHARRVAADDHQPAPWTST